MRPSCAEQHGSTRLSFIKISHFIQMYSHLVVLCCSTSKQRCNCNVKMSEASAKRLPETFRLWPLQGVPRTKCVGGSTWYLRTGRSTSCHNKLWSRSQVRFVPLELQIRLGLHWDPWPVWGGQICHHTQWVATRTKLRFPTFARARVQGEKSENYSRYTGICRNNIYLYIHTN